MHDFAASIVPIHSLWRWVVLILGLAATIAALTGWLGRRPFTPLDHRLGGFYAMSLDIQVLLGLILWIGEQRWAPLFSGAMAAGQTRFFSFEHPFVMIVALGIAHAGRALSRRAMGAPTVSRGGAGDAGAAALAVQPALTATAAHRNAAIFYLLSLILIVAFIPWDRMFR